MIIYINGRFLGEPVTGIQKYAMAMLQHMERLLKKEQIVILLMPNGTQCKEKFEHIKVQSCGHLQGNLWEQIELPFFSRNGFLLNLCSRAPLIKKRQLIVIHDAAICETPDRFSWQYRFFWRSMYFLLGRYLDNIITVSEFSKRDVCRFFYIDPRKVQVLYAGREHLYSIIPDEEVIKRDALYNQKYILAVGGTSNKNFSEIVDALPYLQDLNIVLVVVGKLDTSYKILLYKEKNIRILGYVTDQKLVALYKNAACLVFPSIYEGFGIPPIEAMTLGCPVIAADKASLPEVCGMAALYCNPYDAHDLAKKIRQVVSDDIFADCMRYRGYEQIKKFSWQESAKKLLYYVM